MAQAFWKDKFVLITGYEGFLGSNLTRKLISLGAKVTGLDIKIRKKPSILQRNDYRNISSIRADVRDYGLLKKVIRKHKPEVIFHLAAKAIVGECQSYPLESFSNNIQGTWNILDCCRQAASVKVIIIASSDKAYGEHRKLPYKENTPLTGLHPYDVSKSCADLIAQAYFHSYGLPTAITRCGNIYGPGDFNFSRLIPGAIKSIFGGKVFEIRSDGKYIRDYIYVDDVVRGYILLAEQMQKKRLFGEAFNFSNELPSSVMHVVREIYRIYGKKPNYRILNMAKCEIKRQYLSAAKARSILGWKPQHSLEAGLRKTIQAYL